VSGVDHRRGVRLCWTLSAISGVALVLSLIGVLPTMSLAGYAWVGLSFVAFGLGAWRAGLDSLHAVEHD
jgi:hypothetical protein